jgi:hypothetical protein
VTEWHPLEAALLLPVGECCCCEWPKPISRLLPSGCCRCVDCDTDPYPLDGQECPHGIDPPLWREDPEADQD